MVRIYKCDTYNFILLFWLSVRAVAGKTADFILEKDVFVNHGLRNLTTATDLQCGVACMLDGSCVSASYNDTNKVCQANDKNPYIDGTATTISSVGWTSFYYKQRCRSDWYFYSGSCYLPVTFARNWIGSESHCQSLGGHLVDIQDTAENQFVRELALNASTHDHYWIGLNDQDVEGEMVWSSSAPNQFQQTMNLNADDRDCAFMNVPGDEWIFYSCSSNIDFSICNAGK